MNRLGRAVVLLFLGVVVARLLWTGAFGWFVQQRMRWPLIIAAAVLVIFGLYEAIDGFREDAYDEDARSRSRGPRVGWLMVLPMLVIVSVAPAALGAAAADRVDALVPTERTVDRFEPLDASAGPVPMSVFEFLDRAAWDEERSLDGTPIRLEGLVVNDDTVTDGFKLTRFMVSCCAADGIPLQVTVHGVDAPLADDTWVVADVIWREPPAPYQDDEDGNWTIEADAVSITVLPEAPYDPYESPYAF